MVSLSPAFAVAGAKLLKAMGSLKVSGVFVSISPCADLTTTFPGIASCGITITISVLLFETNSLISIPGCNTIVVTLSRFCPINFNSPPRNAGDGPYTLNFTVTRSSSSVRSHEVKSNAAKSTIALKLLNKNLFIKNLFILCRIIFYIFFFG